jgi:hypothetical protein
MEKGWCSIPPEGISGRSAHSTVPRQLPTLLRELDGCAFDFFMFLGAVAFTAQRIQGQFSCLLTSCRAYAVHLLIRRKLTGRHFQARQEHGDAWNAPLKVFLLLCCGAQATLRYSWCNPPKTGTEMIRSPHSSGGIQVTFPCGTRCWMP